MPTILCSYCDMTFGGLSIQDAWDKAEDHEKQFHRTERIEDGLEDD